jgi:hypothetical protein
LVNVIDPPTADKIGIERYPQTKPLDLDILGPHLDRSTRIPGYLVPISLPGVVAFVAPGYVYDESPMNAMNIISAPQLVFTNGTVKLRHTKSRPTPDDIISTIF